MKTSARVRSGTCASAGAHHGARSSEGRAAPPRCIPATPPYRGLKDRLANLKALHAAMADNVTFPWPLDTLEEIVALMVPTAKGSSTVAIRLSKAKVRHVTLTEEAALCFRKWSRGRDPNKHVFLRHDGAVWGPSHQQCPLEQASKAAGVAPQITFHVLRHTHASQLALRGVPMAVIAKQLGHADTRMTEKHYAHLAPNYVAETIRASFPVLGIAEVPAPVAVRDAPAAGNRWRPREPF